MDECLSLQDTVWNISGANTVHHTFVLWMVLGAIGAFICLIQGVLWYFQPRNYYRRLARQHMKKVLKAPNVDTQIGLLHKCHYLVFEELVVLIFSRCRQVKHCRSTPYTRDGGFDGFARIKIDGAYHRAGIQSKRYTGYINRKDLSRFRSVCSKRKLIPVFVFTGMISQANLKYASDVGIYVIDEDALLRVLITKDLRARGLE